MSERQIEKVAEAIIGMMLHANDLKQTFKSDYILGKAPDALLEISGACSVLAALGIYYEVETYDAGGYWLYSGLVIEDREYWASRYAKN